MQFCVINKIQQEFQEREKAFNCGKLVANGIRWFNCISIPLKWNLSYIDPLPHK